MHNFITYRVTITTWILEQEFFGVLNKIRNLASSQDSLQRLLLELTPGFNFLGFKICRCHRSEIAGCVVCKRLEFTDQVRLITVPTVIRQIS